MRKQPDMQELNAFVDGELDLRRQLEIEALLVDDATLRAQVEGVRTVRDAIRGGAEYYAVPAALQARVRGLVVVPPAASERVSKPPSSARAAARRWFAWRPLAASFGTLTVLTVAVNLALLQRGHEERLGEEVVASHVRATLGGHLVDVQSSERHTVKPWLSSRLDFSPPVREPKVAGLVFEGARVDYLDGRPVAALVYKQGEHVVESFVWPANGNEDRTAVSLQRGFHLAHWHRRGMAHWLVSDLNPEEFASLVRAFEAADVAP